MIINEDTNIGNVFASLDGRAIEAMSRDELLVLLSMVMDAYREAMGRHMDDQKRYLRDSKLVPLAALIFPDDGDPVH